MSPQTIENRRLISFCPTFDGKTPSELVLTCGGCGFYFLACCRLLASKKGKPYDPCHHDPVVFVDGACSNNGSIDVQAVAGIGIAMGIHDEARSSIPIHHAMDPSGRRTSQRAELLAAIHGLRRALDSEVISEQGHPLQSEDSLEKLIVIAADSEYVVKGMTEWYTSWKKRGWRTVQGKPPTNLDLFHELNQLVEESETDSLKIAFWHIPREHNGVADQLAKQAVQSAIRDASSGSAGNSLTYLRTGVMLIGD